MGCRFFKTPNSTAWIKGKIFATFLKVPPTSSRSNHTPESQAVRLVSNAPQIPPTCFMLKILPQRSPSAIKNNDTGKINITTYKIVTVIGSPSTIAVI